MLLRPVLSKINVRCTFGSVMMSVEGQMTEDGDQRTEDRVDNHEPRTMNYLEDRSTDYADFRRLKKNERSYKISKGGGYRWTDFLPSVDNLWKLNIIFREYLALGWYNLNSSGRAQSNASGRIQRGKNLTGRVGQAKDTEN